MWMTRRSTPCRVPCHAPSAQSAFGLEAGAASEDGASAVSAPSAIHELHRFRRAFIGRPSNLQENSTPPRSRRYYDGGIRRMRRDLREFGTLRLLDRRRSDMTQTPRSPQEYPYETHLDILHPPLERIDV